MAINNLLLRKGVSLCLSLSVVGHILSADDEIAPSSPPDTKISEPAPPNV